MRNGTGPFGPVRSNLYWHRIGHDIFTKIHRIMRLQITERCTADLTTAAVITSVSYKRWWTKVGRSEWVPPRLAARAACVGMKSWRNGCAPPPRLPLTRPANSPAEAREVFCIWITPLFNINRSNFNQRRNKCAMRLPIVISRRLFSLSVFIRPPGSVMG